MVLHLLILTILILILLLYRATSEQILYAFHWDIISGSLVSKKVERNKPTIKPNIKPINSNY